MITLERSKSRVTPQDSYKYLGKDEWMSSLYGMLRIPSNTTVQYSGIVAAAYDVLLAVWGTYMLLEAFNLKTFFQYAPFYFVEAYLAICLILWLAFEKVLCPAIVEFKKSVFWNLNMASKRMQQIILSECRYLQRLYWAQLVLTSILIGNNLYLWRSDYAKYYIISTVVIEQFPAISPYFHWISAALTLPISVSIVSSAWFSLYLISYLKFQVLMLGDRIDAFTQSTDWKNSTDLIGSEKYQRKVKENLRFFICRHQEIIKASADLQERGEQYNFWFVLSTGIVGCYTIFTIFSDLFNWFISCLAFFTFMFGVFTIAQRIQFYEDSAEEFADIVYNLPWYLWNMENLRTFTIFHQYTSRRIIKLPYPTYMMSDYTIVKSFAKLMYSLANLFHTTKHRGGGSSFSSN